MCVFCGTAVSLRQLLARLEGGRHIEANILVSGLAVSTTRTEYIYIWVLGAGGVARPLVRAHALLFLPRARNNGTGAAPALLDDFASLALASRSGH